MNFFRSLDNIKQSSIDKKNLDGYDKILSDYKENIHADQIDKPYVEKFLKKLQPNAKILDYGCGSGELTEGLKNHGFDVTGTDISDSFLNVAQKHNTENLFLKADSKQLTEKKLKFDAIISAYSIIHLHNNSVRYVLSDFRKLLNDDGYLYLALQENPRLKNTEHYIQDMSGLYPVPYKKDVKLWLKLFRPGEIENMLRVEGFNVLDIDFRDPVKNEFLFRKMFITAQKKEDRDHTPWVTKNPHDYYEV